MDTSADNFTSIDLRLRSLLGKERKTQVEFLFAFGEYEHGRGFVKLGYASVWDYGSRELKLLKGQVYRRLHSARILRIAPQAAGYLLDGRMSMTTLAMLKDVISPDNADEFLQKCAGRSKDEVEYIVRCAEAKVVSKKEVLRKMPSRTVKNPPASGRNPSLDFNKDSRPKSDLPLPDPPPTPSEETATPAEPSPASAEHEEVVEERTIQLPPKRVEIVEALSEEQFLLKLLVGKDFVEILENARKFLSHKVPSGSIAGVLREALLLVLAREAAKHGPKAPRGKKKTSREVPTAPRQEPAKAAAGSPSSADEASSKPAAETAEVLPAELVNFLSQNYKRIAVPVATLRLLWEDEGGKCTAPLANGEICGSEWQLEPDHKIPVAHGGTNDRENLRLRCRAHNLQAARDTFGDSLIERFTRKK